MRTRSVAKRRGSASSTSEYDGLFSHALKLVCIGGFDGWLRHMNPAISSAFGYQPDEMASMHVRDLVHPDDWPETNALIQGLAGGQSVGGAEVRVRAKNGEYRWVLWDAVPCCDQGVFLGTGYDISSRKAAEEALRQRDKRFQLIAGITGEAIWDWDLRTNQVWRNQTFLKMFGVPDAQTAGSIEWWQQRAHPDDVDRVLAALPAPGVFARRPWTVEYRIRLRDGSYAHVYDRGFVIEDDDGNPVRMVGSILDVSPLKRAEEELRESGERFRLAAQATRDVIWDWDMRAGRVWRGDGFEEVFGYTADQVSNELEWWVEQTHPDDRERVCAKIEALRERRIEQYSTEYRFRRADGSYADVLERAFVMYNDRDRPVRIVGSLMDISDRRHAEELLRLQQAELAHTDRISTMGEVATGLAHELNQPLAAIANFAESCKQVIDSGAPDSHDKLREWVARIAANTDRAGQMIRRLRAFTRKSEPHRAPVELTELVHDVIELVGSESRRRNMRVRWEPSKEPVPRVEVDPVQIQQVLVNLMHNAFDAARDMPPERRQIVVEAKAQGNAVELSVADQGRGIPREQRERVFEAFYSTKTSGVGIGLAISRSIVENHGGKLWFSPNPRHGTTFHFTVPVPGADHGSDAHRNGRG